MLAVSGVRDHQPLRGKLGWMTPRAGAKTPLALRRAFGGSRSQAGVPVLLEFAGPSAWRVSAGRDYLLPIALLQILLNFLLAQPSDAAEITSDDHACPIDFRRTISTSEGSACSRSMPRSEGSRWSVNCPSDPDDLLRSVQMQELSIATNGSGGMLIF